MCRRDRWEHSISNACNAYNEGTFREISWVTHTSIFLFVGKDTCAGDSGGPLLVKSDRQSPSFLLGIVSFGTKTCGAGSPGVYTRIDKYIPWILSHLQP